MRNIQLSITAIFFSLLLVACGGGGTLDGGSNGGTGVEPVFTLQLELIDSTNTQSNQLSDDQPLIARATLSATNNGNIDGRVIEFEFSTDGLATLTANSGTALTNSAGVAEIGLNAGTVSGAGELRATLQNTDVTRAAGFNSAGDGGEDIGVVVDSVRLLADRTQLGSGVSDVLQLSALVRDNNNVLLEGIKVSFSTDSGELAEFESGLTGPNGVAKATLTSQIDKSVRDILVNARVNNISDQLQIRVVGTTLEVVAPSAVVLGDQVSVNFSLQDASGQGIANEVLTVSSDIGNPLSQTSPVTSSNGQVSITYDAVTSGDDTLMVSALGLSQTVRVSVKADSFVFLSSADEAEIPEVDLNAPKSMLFEWLTDNIANANRDVLFSTTRGRIADTVLGLNQPSVVAVSSTDADGQAEVFVQSSFAGLATISAQGGDNEVSTQKVVEFVATNPTKIETQAFPAQLVPGDSSSIRAIVRDAKNNPVKNQLVAFSLDNSAGGSISSGTASTNSQGVATTSFTADLTTGAGIEGKNLIVSASLVNNANITDSTDIAVGGRTLFFRFGTGNILQKPSDSDYRKEFSIFVTDASGNPIANQPLNIAAVPLRYRKGGWFKSPSDTDFKQWDPDYSAHCLNEDSNFNGILDLDYDADGKPIPCSGEDQNCDGQLTPGNRATVPASVVSNQEGIAVFAVTYPRDVGAFLDVRIQVTGFASGTENIHFREYSLPVGIEERTVETSSPPLSPFGLSATCTDIN